MSERERFERYAKARSLPLDRMPDGRYRNMHANEAWLAWQAACPEGWQCVPKEIHNDMLCAVGNHYGTEHEKAFEDAWDDALLAAPNPEHVE